MDWSWSGVFRVKCLESVVSSFFWSSQFSQYVRMSSYHTIHDEWCILLVYVPSMLEAQGWTLFISDLELCTTVVVRLAVTGPDSSWMLSGQHTELLSRR